MPRVSSCYDKIVSRGLLYKPQPCMFRCSLAAGESLDKACGLPPAHCVSSSAVSPAEAVGLQKMDPSPKMQTSWTSNWRTWSQWI